MAVGKISGSASIHLRRKKRILTPVSYTHLDVYKRQRLSHEDELQGESNSISNQKRILETYAKQNGFSNLRWYTDDGYSGAPVIGRKLPAAGCLCMLYNVL